MNRLRQRGSVRISFFSFQDIITSVTGILILVTLMLSFSLKLDEEPEERRLEKQLKEQRERLAAVEKENSAMQRRRIEATTLPDPAQVRAQIESLHREDAQMQQQRERSEQELKTLRERIAASTPPATLRAEVAQLEKRVEELRQKLAKEKTNSNVLLVIPDPEAQRAQKKPVAMVVSGDSLKAQRIEGSGSQEIPISSGESLRSVLRRFDPAREFVVFYFRPSGAKWFDAFRDEARRAGFEVGYDAVEEQKEVVFSAP
jgi:hypothetical protein